MVAILSLPNAVQHFCGNRDLNRAWKFVIYINHPSPVRIIMPAPAIENVSPVVERDTRAVYGVVPPLGGRRSRGSLRWRKQCGSLNLFKEQTCRELAGTCRESAAESGKTTRLHGCSQRPKPRRCHCMNSTLRPQLQARVMLQPTDYTKNQNTCKNPSRSARWNLPRTCRKFGRNDGFCSDL